MRCVKCNMELSEGSRFCEYCGAPQPEKPQQRIRYCNRCGNELPTGSRFCTFCGAQLPGQGTGAMPPYTGQPGQGAGAMPPHTGLPGQQYHSPLESPDQGNKNKAVLIACIAGAGVLVILLIVAAVLFITGKKDDGWGESERTESSRTEEKTEPEEEESLLPEEEEAQEPEPAEEQEAEVESATEQDQGENGPYAEVDFDEISYMPEDQPYDVLTEDEMNAFNEWLSRGVEFTTTESVEGTVYSLSQHRDLVTTVYYEPGTGEIRTIVTAEEQLMGAQVVVTGYLFQDGELVIVREDTYTGSTEPQYETLYFFQKNCMIAEQSMFSVVSNALTYLREDMASLDDKEQEDFMEDEAKYYNRAYKLYDAVSQW